MKRFALFVGVYYGLGATLLPYGFHLSVKPEKWRLRWLWGGREKILINRGWTQKESV